MTFAGRRSVLGFTMVELIIVIAISGVIAAALGVFIVRPIQGYYAQVHRAELVDSAESALRRMQRDIRHALPNSVRIRDVGGAPANGKVIEVLRTIDGGRYRLNPPPGAPTTRLNFAVADADFDMIGNLLCTTDPQITGACATYNPNYWLVIYSLGQPGADAYAGTDVITAGLTVTSGVAADGSDHININPGFDFALESPRQRFFIVDTPVSYVCDRIAGTLNRYQGYGLTANQADIDTNAELDALVPETAADLIVADKVLDCTITYNPGSSERAGIVTIGITIQDPETGERVRLLHQVHVDNTA